MKLGVITDSHANLPALLTALEAMKNEGCELIIHTGDAIGIGPHPREVLEVLREQKAMVFTMGNHDELFAFGIADPVPDWMSEGELAHQLWTHEQLDASWKEWIQGWPYSFDYTLGTTASRFQHYALKDNEFARISRSNDPGELDDIFRPVTDIVFFGHHHPQADVLGMARYINPGALGCHASLGARFAVLEIDNSGHLKVELRSAPYDARLVYGDMIARNVPEADFLLKTFLL